MRNHVTFEQATARLMYLGRSYEEVLRTVRSPEELEAIRSDFGRNDEIKLEHFLEMKYPLDRF